MADIMGMANASSTVTINSQPTYRKGEYFRKEFTLDNSSAALYFGVTNVGVLNGTTEDIVTTNIGNIFVPKALERFDCDADGNLTNDGRWSYTWDAENRLVSMQSFSTAPTASKYWLQFTNDWQGRRIQKVVYTNNGSIWMLAGTTKFVYDGWNLIATLNSSSALTAAYTWGPDLSGTQQGAGGVGGLLFESVSGTQAFVCHDGNGNVTMLVNAADAKPIAQYDYGPFGELVRATGPMAKANPFRFSTKYTDDESDLVYYGYRYYNPSTGRWLSRDPLGERGGKNLYAIGFNHPIYGVDAYGLDWLQDTANYMGGVGDSLTFGLTYQARKGLHWMLFDEYDSGVNPQSDAYIAGEATETVVEIAVTAGGATLRHVAKHTTRTALGANRGIAQFRRVNNLEGGFVHHIKTIKGRPPVKGEFGGQLARYPLPFERYASSSWNMKWVPTRAAHAAEHARDLRLEALDRLRESTLLVRQGANELALYVEGQRPCSDWEINISATVKGSGSEGGSIPSDPSVVIEVGVGEQEFE